MGFKVEEKFLGITELVAVLNDDRHPEEGYFAILEAISQEYPVSMKV